MLFKVKKILCPLCSVIVLSLTVQLTLCAQDIRIREITYEYVYPDYMSREQARSAAVEKAKIKLLADEYGTLVSSVTNTTISSINGESVSNTYEIGESEVQGEWLETIGEPVVKWDIRNGDQFVAIVTIKGKIREIVRNTVNFDCALLRNGSDDSCESSFFTSNDNMSIKFRTPLQGYLAVYVIEDAATVRRLLPTNSSKGNLIPVQANKRYVFFSPDDPSQNNLSLYTDKDIEYDRLYMIFSTDSFILPADETDPDLKSWELPTNFISDKEFQSWLIKNRKRDDRMSVKILDFSICKSAE